MKKTSLVIAAIVGILIGYLMTTFIIQKKPELQLVSHIVGLDGGAGALLNVDQAEIYLANFRATHVGDPSICFSVDIDEVQRFMNIPGCQKIRAYFGVQDRLQPNTITLMFMGVNSAGENLFIRDHGDDYVVDYTSPCPKDCPPTDRRTIKP